MRGLLVLGLLALSACGTVAAPTDPTLFEVAPDNARAGETVVLRGAALGETQGDSWVTVRGTPAAIAAWSDVRIELIVPDVDPGGTVIVVNRPSVRSEPFDFVVIP